MDKKENRSIDPVGIAEIATDPAKNAALVIRSFFQEGDPDVRTALEIMDKTIAEVQGGSMKPAEAILVSQAKALDSLFMSFVMIAQKNAKNTKTLEPLMRIALKAQNQCRATIQTLNEVKNPRSVAYVQQANISNGHQQVNNGVAGEKNQIEQNKLSGEENALLKNERTSQAPIRTDTQMETMGEIVWSEIGGGEKQGGTERIQRGIKGEVEKGVQVASRTEGGAE